MRILLRGVKPLGRAKRDILIEKGVISQVSSHIDSSYDKAFDLDGAVLLPSLVDLHSHTRQPGGDEQETLESFSRAAVHGGVTAAVSMPNTSPVVDSPSIVSWLVSESRKIGLVDILPAASITVGQQGRQLTEMAELKKAGAVAITEDGLAVEDSRLMRYALEYAKTVGLPVLLHCEDRRLSDGGAMNEGRVSLELGLRGIPEISETVGILRDLEIAAYVGARVHICHISLARSVAIISFYKKQFPGLISCETAPHYMIFSEEDVRGYSTNLKMNPPLRRDSDRKAIIKALKRQEIDCIATDHAPHTVWDKELEFSSAPFGIVGVETWLSSLIHYFVRPGILEWEDVVRLCCDNPRRILGLPVVRLEEGSVADLVVIDPDSEWQVDEETLFSRSKNSPFLGQRLKGKILLTIKSGRIVYSDY